MTDVFWLAWAAGIFDGEGSVFLIRQSNRGKRGTGKNDRLVVKVVNTDPRMLVRLREIAGGRISSQRIRGTRRPSWEWITTGVSAKAFLRMVRPWLVVKGEQADVALTFTTGVRGGGRGHFLDPAEDARRTVIQQRLRVLKTEVS